MTADFIPMNKMHGFKKWIIFRHNEDEARKRLFDMAAHKRKMSKVNAEFHKKFEKYEKDLIDEVVMKMIYKRYFSNLPRHQVTTKHIHQCCSIGIRGIEFYGIPLFTYSAHDHRRARNCHWPAEGSWNELKTWMTTYRSCVQYYTSDKYTEHIQVSNDLSVVRDYFC